MKKTFFVAAAFILLVYLEAYSEETTISFQNRTPAMSKPGSALTMPSASSYNRTGNSTPGQALTMPSTTSYNVNQTANRVREQDRRARDRDRDRGDRRFRDDFWRGRNTPYNDGWGYSTWSGVSGYLGYDYGDYPVYYSDGVSYPVEQSTVVQPIIIEQKPAPLPAQTQPASEWMPLGVFTLTDLKAAANTNLYMQLAINRSGAIQGVFYNSALNTTYSVVGYTDKKSQKAVWKVANVDNAPIMESGIYNLTLEQTPIQIFFPDGVIQDWLLVRLSQ